MSEKKLVSHKQKSEARGWRDGSSQGAEFSSQHPDGGLESSIMESDALSGIHACMQIEYS